MYWFSHLSVHILCRYDYYYINREKIKSMKWDTTINSKDKGLLKKLFFFLLLCNRLFYNNYAKMIISIREVIFLLIAVLIEPIKYTSSALLIVSFDAMTPSDICTLNILLNGKSTLYNLIFTASSAAYMEPRFPTKTHCNHMSIATVRNHFGYV